MRPFGKRPFATLLALALLVPTLMACGNNSTAGSSPEATTAPGAVAAPESGGAGKSGKLTLAGSSALLPLIQAAAQEYQKTHTDVQITVTAGGSGAGRTQVCESKIDIGNSDVPLKDEERTSLKCADAQEFPVAIQAFDAVANKQGPGSVTNLTKDQLAGIFSGQITNWKELGGDDQPIVLINRAKGSGTRSNMAKFLFDGDDAKFAIGESEEDNSETVKTTVAQTPGAISYLGFSYLNDPELVAFSIDGVAPTKEDIKAGKWPIGGPGYMITRDAPNETAKGFIDYVTGEFQANAAFDTLGFVPVK